MHDITPLYDFVGNIATRAEIKRAAGFKEIKIPIAEIEALLKLSRAALEIYQGESWILPGNSPELVEPLVRLVARLSERVETKGAAGQARTQVPIFELQSLLTLSQVALDLHRAIPQK